MERLDPLEPPDRVVIGEEIEGLGNFRRLESKFRLSPELVVFTETFPLDNFEFRTVPGVEFLEMIRLVSYITTEG
jgi:hypothetical protein